MDGNELLTRVITTIQEMHLKIGDSDGSASLYYPYEGDPDKIKKEFKEATKNKFKGMELEILPERLRVIVSEKDCRRIAELPVKETMKDITSLVRDNVSMNDFESFVAEKYPSARLIRSKYIDFDWILVFPEELDDDVYCLSEEMGRVTYHRFSKEEFALLGFEIEG